MEKYRDKVLQIEGEVEQSQKSAISNDWLLKLRGHRMADGDFASVMCLFLVSNPDNVPARQLKPGQTVILGGRFLTCGRTAVQLQTEGLQLVKGPAASPAGADPSARRKPDLTASAEEFVQKALADRVAADTQFKGKVVELTGKVSSADPHYNPNGLTLSAGKLKPTDAFGVFAECEVPEGQRDKAWMLAPGQKVKVVGSVWGIEKDKVRLGDCVVTELEPNPIPSAKAEEVAAAYASNARAASTKYGDRYNVKPLFLEGVVKGAQKNQYGTTVLLAGSGKIAVQLQLADTDAKKLRVGDRVRVKADCRGLWPEQGAVIFGGRFLLQPSGGAGAASPVNGSTPGLNESRAATVVTTRLHAQEFPSSDNREASPSSIVPSHQSVFLCILVGRSG
jgi:hypothetical protein